LFSGIFLLLLLPDSSRAAAKAAVAAKSDAATTAVAEMPAAPATVPGAPESEKPEFGRGTYAPLGGAGASPRRFARHLPVEREGGTHFLAVEDVVAVHANAHYTFIFDGSEKQFCPLAIGDVESRVDGDRFVRVHRSHIVNIERLVGFKRSGDNEMVQMAAAHPYLVPVSRGRIGALKSRVAMLSGDTAAPAPRRRHRFAAQ
jgi:DNA-binding LytR/AlgR family response regulator